MAYTYKYRNGFTHKTSADVVGGVLSEIEKGGKAITGEAFLDASRPEDSPTHGMFEWDDSVAAEKYRLRQATNIILSLEVVEVPSEDSICDVDVVDEKPTYKPAYINISRKCPGRTGTYVRTDKAMEDPENRAVILKNAIGELQAFKRKYQGLREMSEVFRSIDSLGKGVNE